MVLALLQGPTSGDLPGTSPGLQTPQERFLGGDSASTRIWVLISQGEFAQARALIAEARAGGLIAAPEATRMLERIGLLSTKLGEIPARLQRVAGFPSQLKEHTLFEIKQLLSKKDFSIATQAQLKQAEKLIEQTERLMEKAATLPR